MQGPGSSEAAKVDQLPVIQEVVSVGPYSSKVDRKLYIHTGRVADLVPNVWPMYQISLQCFD